MHAGRCQSHHALIRLLSLRYPQKQELFNRIHQSITNSQPAHSPAAQNIPEEWQAAATTCWWPPLPRASVNKTQDADT
jgi:hypothetical protein